MTYIEWTTAGCLIWMTLAEWLHGRRRRRVARLAFGPEGAPRPWTRAAPALRVLAAGALAWGLTTLLAIQPKGGRPAHMPEGGYRHLVVALDVSPSMQLKDAGGANGQTRAQRASEVLMSVLRRVAVDQIRISVVAFYTDAKPVVVDTYDLEVVRNIIDDLPLDYAFDIGKTSLIDGVREAVGLAAAWQPGSTTVLVVSDGDTVPDTGLPTLPAAIADIIVLGVGDARSGTYIDGHQSRQDVPTLRQLASRLRGSYHNVNEKHLPSTQLAELAHSVPMRDPSEKGAREFALAAVATGAGVLALLPLALALHGSPWQRPKPAQAQ